MGFKITEQKLKSLAVCFFTDIYFLCTVPVYIYKKKQFFLQIEIEIWVFSSVDSTVNFLLFQLSKKVTEYLFSGWLFFLQTKVDFLTKHFWHFFYLPKGIYVWSLSLKRYLTCD